MKITARLIVVLVLLLVPLQNAFAAPAAPALTYEDPTPPPGPICYGLDVVFLIDQSGSMSGGSGSAANDPQQNRIYAPHYALDWLANNRLGLCPDAVHRMGVVSFGGDARTDLDLGQTQINPDAQAGWDTLQPTLEGRINGADLGATDPAKAFALAKDMLDHAPALGGELRKRAIILLTDGQPCVSGVGCSFDANDPVNTTYLENLVKYVHDNFAFSPALKDQDAAFRAALQQWGKFEDIPQEERDRIFTEHPVAAPEMFSSTYIYIVAMNSSTPYLRIVENAFGGLTRDYGGELIDLPNNLNAVPRVFNDIMSWLAGITPTLLGCGNLPVDPYLSGATLDIFKVADGLEVKINHNGKNLTSGQGDLDYFHVNEYGVHGAVEHYRFVQPPAGLWQIDAANCDGIEASYIQFSPQVTQTLPVGTVPNYNVAGKTYDENHPFYLEYQVKDKELGNPLNNNPDYPLDMKATITAPDGSKTETGMEFVADGRWKSIDPIPVNQLGDYTVEMVAMAPCVADPNNPARCPNPMFEVVRDASGKYTTGNVEPFSVVIFEPADQSNVPLHTSILAGLKIAPVEVVLQVQDKDGNPVPYATYITGDPNTALQVTLSANNETQPVTGLTVSDDGLSLVGQAALPEFEGQNTLMVNVSPNGYDFNRYIPSGLPVVSNFTRSDTWLTNPLFWKVVGGILLALLAVLVAVFIYNRMDPVRGVLKFSSGESYQTVSLYTGWRKSVVRLPAVKARQLGIAKVIAKKTDPLAQSVRIQVQLVSAGKTKQTANLVFTDNGTPVGFGPWAITYTGGGPVGGRGRPQAPRRPQAGAPRPTQPGIRR